MDKAPRRNTNTTLSHPNHSTNFIIKSSNVHLDVPVYIYTKLVKETDTFYFGQTGIAIQTKSA